MKGFLKDKKVALLNQYEEALSYNDYVRAKNIRVKLRFLDELIKEVEA